MKVTVIDPEVERIAADFERKVAEKCGSESNLENILIEMRAEDVYYLLCYLIESGDSGEIREITEDDGC